MIRSLNRTALREAIYTVSVRHDWATTVDTEDRTEEIATEYEHIVADELDAEELDPSAPWNDVSG